MAMCLLGSRSPCRLEDKPGKFRSRDTAASACAQKIWLGAYRSLSDPNTQLSLPSCHVWPHPNYHGRLFRHVFVGEWFPGCIHSLNEGGGGERPLKIGRI